MRSAHLLSSVSASAITAHLGGGGGPVDPGTGRSTSFADISTNLTPVAGWGAIRRNPDYTGPCCRVADLNSAAEVDLYFDEYGFLTALDPYVSTRVIAIYDQWGSDHLYCAKTSGIKLSSPFTMDNCRAFVGTKTGYLRTTLTTSTGAAWAVPDGFWAISYIRRQSDWYQGLFSVDKTSGYASMALWQGHDDLHWRINGSNGYNWPNTSWTANSAEVQNVKGTACGDYTQGAGIGYGYSNGVLKISTAYSAPITYDTGRFLKLFSASSTNDHFYGDIFELHIFSRVSAATAADTTNIHNALSENDADLGIPKSTKFTATKRTTAIRQSSNRISAVKRTTVIRTP